MWIFIHARFSGVYYRRMESRGAERCSKMAEQFFQHVFWWPCAPVARNWWITQYFSSLNFRVCGWRNRAVISDGTKEIFTTFAGSEMWCKNCRFSSDFVCLAVVNADSVGRDSYRDWLRFGKSNSVGWTIFHSSPDPVSCTMGTRSFPAVKWPGRGVDQPLPSKADVKERVEPYLIYI